MEYKNYYKIMGLEKNASQEDIKRAYRKLARKYHPDVSKESDALAKFKEVGEAYEVLKDPEKRKKYDEYGQYWQHAGGGAAGGGAHQQSYSYQAGARDFEDFINSIFGNQGGFGHAGFGTQRGRQQTHHRAQAFYPKGQDVHAQITISLEDSFQGAEKTLQLQVPKIDNYGRETYETRAIKVKIPKGIEDKQQIRLKGQGEMGASGKAGDLYIEIHIRPHAYFHVQKKDIHLDLPISPWEAALGATILVPTLAGSVKLKIPKLSQSGKQMRLKGRGLPATVPGDQIVHLSIVIPDIENDRLTALYEEMAKVANFNPRDTLR